MHAFVFVTLAVILVLYAILGIVAITTGWVVPWLRGTIARPRLWGSGTLLFASGIALFRYGATVHGTTAIDLVFGGGLLVFLSGAALQFLGQRPGRVPSA
ncbi:hypothetical protein ACFOZ0_21645 [Streptomyces yaanensis]|uniref:Uncharacterized protein n=1 Tax=Streptomyces yaanensis TaxID=1142239 RepID=A0ABV7SI32_9ACTN|nr:hypothetical protein [Streptomyces sp. CGMCC 4.7035]WNB97563.1 hypothetical protein Q2K21_05445 [Streptomyces sp. CGMCC 4.7035]